MVVKAGQFFRGAVEGGKEISTLAELEASMMEWFGYNQLDYSPFPSGEPPPEAVHKWYTEHLELIIMGPNRFEWTCPGCRSRVEVETDYLHACAMSDYVFWEFCPLCCVAMSGED